MVPCRQSMDASVNSEPDVALVHDYLLVMRGAERVFAQIAALWPAAPIYTLLYDEAAMNSGFSGRRVQTSGLQRLGVQQHSFRRLLPLFPRAAASLSTGDFDLLVSSSSAFAHGVERRADAQHVCYCHTPFRYAWQDYGRATTNVSPVARPVVRRTLSRVRTWDRRAAARVSHYVANSELTRQRIEEFWGRESVVVNPPVEVDRFHIGEPEDYFLVVAELVRHKQVEIALEAAAQAAQRIKIVGEGPEFKRLRGMYGSTAEFLGRVSDKRLSELYAACRALIVPNVEEFGIAAVEAQASGRPVVAASVGGACETVIDGETGVLITPGNVGVLAEALAQIDFEKFSPERMRSHAQQFAPPFFARKFADAVEELTGVRPPAAPVPLTRADASATGRGGRASTERSSRGS